MLDVFLGTTDASAFFHLHSLNCVFKRTVIVGSESVLMCRVHSLVHFHPQVQLFCLHVTTESVACKETHYVVFISLFSNTREVPKKSTCMLKVNDVKSTEHQNCQKKANTVQTNE